MEFFTFGGTVGEAICGMAIVLIAIAIGTLIGKWVGNKIYGQTVEPDFDTDKIKIENSGKTNGHFNEYQRTMMQMVNGIANNVNKFEALNQENTDLKCENKRLQIELTEMQVTIRSEMDLLKQQHIQMLMILSNQRKDEKR